MHNTICYVRRCEGFACLVLEIQRVELAHRYAKIFRAYDIVVGKESPLLMQFCLTHESQLRLLEQQASHISSTVSFEAAYKPLLIGEGRELLPPNSAFQLEYRNSLCAGERPTSKNPRCIQDSSVSRNIQNLKQPCAKVWEVTPIKRELLCSKNGQWRPLPLNLFRHLIH